MTRWFGACRTGGAPRAWSGKAGCASQSTSSLRTNDIVDQDQTMTCALCLEPAGIIRYFICAGMRGDKQDEVRQAKLARSSRWKSGTGKG